jgi:hypothetical protein
MLLGVLNRCCPCLVIGFWQTQSLHPKWNWPIEKNHGCMHITCTPCKLSSVGKSFNFWVNCMDASALLQKSLSQIHYHCIANVPIMIWFCACGKVMSHWSENQVRWFYNFWEDIALLHQILASVVISSVLMAHIIVALLWCSLSLCSDDVCRLSLEMWTDHREWNYYACNWYETAKHEGTIPNFYLYTFFRLESHEAG